MSPTMTEGNIAAWKVKEGDSYSTGDVLLEIETDKAQMDVEAQEEGIMAKIVQPDGSKSIKVGTTIAVLAEEGDDLSSLEMPAPESAAPPPEAPQKPSKQSEESKPAPSTSQDSAAKPPSPGKTSATPRHQKYPLYPSVAQLLHENGLDLSEADKIPASGPNGRLLKGDVLAHLGAIDAAYPGQQADRLAKLGHLDLSNIKLAPPPPPAPKPEAAAAPAPAPPEEPADVEVAIPISLEAVAAARHRLRKALHIDVPIETFVARAIGLANAALPPPRRAATADELFDQVLGRDAVRPATVRGSFLPDIMPVAAMTPPPPPGPTPLPDVYDILSGTAPRGRSRRSSVAPVEVEVDETLNTFSVRAPKGDERRARVFLERMKTALQVDPGNLII